jgi:thymidylate synthase (FAD)
MKITLLQNKTTQNQKDIYTFCIKEINQTLVEEFRNIYLSNISIESSLNSLENLKKEYPISSMDTLRASKYISLSAQKEENVNLLKILEQLRVSLQTGIKENLDDYKYPETFHLSLTCNIEKKNIQDIFLQANSSSANKNIKDFSRAIYKSLPKEQRTLFEDYL